MLAMVPHPANRSPVVSEYYHRRAARPCTVRNTHQASKCEASLVRQLLALTIVNQPNLSACTRRKDSVPTMMSVQLQLVRTGFWCHPV